MTISFLVRSKGPKRWFTVAEKCKRSCHIVEKSIDDVSVIFFRSDFIYTCDYLSFDMNRYDKGDKLNFNFTFRQQLLKYYHKLSGMLSFMRRHVLAVLERKNLKKTNKFLF